MEDQRTFGSWLRRRRKSLDLTQSGLADEVGCSAATIRKIEAEERRPSAQMVERMADIFQIPAQERKSFLRFSRGDWKYAPNSPVAEKPWQPSSVSARANLTAPPTSLIGREQDIAAVRKYLADPAIRLVTLLGPPGIGKTRLGLEIARGVIQDYPDGVIFISLVTLNDPDLIAPTIVQALGLLETKNRSPIDILLGGIADKQMLLVLDNLEHLIEGVARLVSAILPTCPYLKLLTTSRESLRIPGEWIYQVPGLEIPPVSQEQPLDLTTAAGFTAVKLFVERARAVQPNFSLTVNNLPAISALCKRLDGLPLAIELTAARIRISTPQALLMQMDEQFMLHSESMRTLPERQKTLHNAIRWSYDLLSLEEKNLFSGLSVFRGGFTIEAVEAIFPLASKTIPVTELLGQLVDKSLVKLMSSEDRKPRFNMLVTIHQFATARLQDAPDETAIHERHLNYFLNLAEEAEQNIRGPDQVYWIDQLEMEHENLRAGLEWCVARQQTQTAMHLLDVVAWPWRVHNYWSEIQNWYEKIRPLPGFTDHPILHAKILNHLSHQYWVMGDFAEARQVNDECQAISLAQGAAGEETLAQSLIYQGMLERASLGDSIKARSYFEQSYTLYLKLEDQHGIAFTLVHWGSCEVDNHQEQAALSYYQKGLELFQEVGDIWGIARASQRLGELHLTLGNYASALEMFEQHLRLDEQLQFRDGIQVALTNLGEYYRYRGEFAQAELYYQKSLEMARTYAMKWGLSYDLFVLGLLALQRNEFPTAKKYFIDYYHLAFTIYEGETSIADALISLAAVAGAMHQPERAAKIYGAFVPYLAKMSMSYSPFDFAEFEKHIRKARQDLGEATFEALAQEGSQMSSDEAMAYALEDERISLSVARSEKNNL
ncbi:MAG TPA: tetratricopeptide repeat protein [Bellilinea sp.]|nr:tetratricopeptide repeat protein [Bellilinea sp.]